MKDFPQKVLITTRNLRIVAYEAFKELKGIFRVIPDTYEMVSVNIRPGSSWEKLTDKEKKLARQEDKTFKIFSEMKVEEL